ncbi:MULTISPECIES: 3-keto-5-aminohexanoate cleavage protein [Burkholderiaceae]|nr:MULTISPECIES: 3-keto-5-aminohexanoate cleavage protein [Burkholderiaceae]MCE4547966.1 3-keto-5-aminohexanoate cleavage protein [Caballeronia sp. PC1]MCE4575526.1 3-keto-5-aminohexanoate cleavage protein [Caballeronia sp. CLC5]
MTKRKVLLTAALLFGGHAHVGQEDKLYYRRGRVNRQHLTERIVRIIREMNMETATAAEDPP